MLTLREEVETSPVRVWFNQPSTLQPFHNYHGKVGIAIPPVTVSRLGRQYDSVRVCFTEGPVENMIVFINVLSRKRG